MMTRIAKITNGQYFRATDREELIKIYEQIDALERTRIESEAFTNYTDRFSWFILPALGILLVELMLGQAILREIP